MKKSLSIRPVYTKKACGIICSLLDRIVEAFQKKAVESRKAGFSGRQPKEPDLIRWFDRAGQKLDGHVELESVYMNLSNCKFSGKPELLSASLSRELRKAADSLNAPKEEVLCLADVLAGKPESALVKAYGKQMVAEVVGAPLNPLLVEQKKVIMEELERMIADIDAKLQANLQQYEDGLEEARKKLLDEKLRKDRPLLLEREQKRQELLKKLSEIK